MRLGRLPTLVVVAVIALIARLAPVVRTDSLVGVGSLDDGVYYAASRLLWLGELPYRDFTFVHTPGITWLIAPATALEPWLGDSGAAAAARLLIMLVGTATATLIAGLAWRYGPWAAAVAGLAYAVLPAGCERCVFLEPPLNLALVLAVAAIRLALSRRQSWWILAAGCALAVAISMKIWAVGPALALACFVLARCGWRELGRLAMGLGAGLAVAIGPFFALAPASAITQTVTAQSSRGRVPQSLGIRVGLFTESGPTWAFFACLTAAVIAGIAIVVLLTRRPGLRARLPESLAWAAMGAAALAELLVGPSFYDHYVAFLWPWLALLLGVGAGFAVRFVRDARIRVGIGAAGLTAAAWVLLGVIGGPPGWTHKPAFDLAAATHTDGCTFARISAHLVASDSLTANATRRCAFPVDWTGMLMMRNVGAPMPEERHFPALRERGDLYGGFTRAALESQVVLTSQVWADEIDLKGHGFEPVDGGGATQVWRPVGRG